MGALIIRRVKMLDKGSREILQSQGVQDELMARAEHIAEAAGPGFVARVRVDEDRARAAVSATTWDAAMSEFRDRALTRAIDAGRDA